MGRLNAVVDATERVRSLLDADDAVSYAEVGGVERRGTDGRATNEGVRSATDIDESGVWWRLFAEGSADYRFTTSLDGEHLSELVEGSVRSARLLDQREPARYDGETVHRAFHPGWAGGASVVDSSAEEKLDRVHAAFSSALDGTPVERATVTYRDERERSVLMTTTGTTLQTTLDRVAVGSVVVPVDGPKVHEHAGATTGLGFLDSLADRFDAQVSRARGAAGADRTTLDADGTTDVVFGPRAAGELFHQFAHYFEIDAVYLGASPFDVGDRVGPRFLDVEDTVRAGSWAARAYDAEGRPTHPVTLVSNGVVRNRLYDTAASIEEDAFPAGSVVPSVGFERPPRVHARHLDVSGGDATVEGLCADADVYVDAVGPPRVRNEATRTKRASAMPPSILYAKDIGRTTPSGFATEAEAQELAFPIRRGYALEGGERSGTFSNGTIVVSLDDFRSISGASAARETYTGTCLKHRSTLPVAVTAPAVRVSVRVRPD